MRPGRELLRCMRGALPEGCVPLGDWALENTVLDSKAGIVGRKADLLFGISAMSSRRSRSSRVTEGSDMCDLKDGRDGMGWLATKRSCFSFIFSDLCFLFSAFFVLRSFFRAFAMGGRRPKSLERGISNRLPSSSASYRASSPKSMAHDPVSSW